MPAIETLRYAALALAPGRMLMVASDQGLRGLRFSTKAEDERNLAEIRHKYPKAILKADAALAASWRDRLNAALAGKLSIKKLPLDLVGTPFQVAVWEALCRIPWGQSSTYADIAHEVGSPRGVRAVGSACGANQIVMLVPCHRVLRQGGGLGGYFYGLDKKRELLEREGIKSV